MTQQPSKLWCIADVLGQLWRERDASVWTAEAADDLAAVVGELLEMRRSVTAELKKIGTYPRETSTTLLYVRLDAAHKRFEERRAKAKALAKSRLSGVGGEGAVGGGGDTVR